MFYSKNMRPGLVLFLFLIYGQPIAELVALIYLSTALFGRGSTPKGFFVGVIPNSKESNIKKLKNLLRGDTPPPFPNPPIFSLSYENQFV